MAGRRAVRGTAPPHGPSPGSPDARWLIAAAMSLAAHVIAVIGPPRLDGRLADAPSGVIAMTVRTIASPMPSSKEPNGRSGESPTSSTIDAAKVPQGGATVRGESRSVTAASSAPIPARLARTVDADYRGAATLDPGPEPIEDIVPAYPSEAGMQEGTVTLRVLVGADGTVDGVQVLASQPAGVFERSAVEAFERSRFRPGRLNGVAVRSQIAVELHFQPYNRGSAVSGGVY